ncbi:MAG: tRNA pseudouridine(38-40) synthase TruA, partial [Deltaproteobacteria bacterium]
MTCRQIRLLVEYDGTPYHGWQWQAHHPSVQQTLTRVLQQLCKQPELLVRAAGRTDAGVHACGQVAVFCTDSPMEARRFTPALNRFLPDTIRIHRSDEVPLSFDPRLDARRKRYRYRIYEGPQSTALDVRRAWHLRRHLDLTQLRQAADHLLGERDFNAFRSAHCDAAHAVRTMQTIEVHSTVRPPVGRLVDITFEANAFCRHMCRIFAGTVVDIATATLAPAALSLA